MKRILIIGIGAGNPDHVTMQAIKAMNSVDVFFFLDKGQEKEDLINLRKTICERYIESRSYRVVEVRSPERDASSSDYKAGVGAWHAAKADIFSRLIADEIKEGECGAFLIWGDPSLYDSTLRVIDLILRKGELSFDYEVIPGITSIQALTARHRITLNELGESVRITTGRKLRGHALEDTTTVVMLDDGSTLKTLPDQDIDIYWGAYLGTPDEILISGSLRERIEEIESARAREKRRKGWIMDTYLLRRPVRA